MGLPSPAPDRLVRAAAAGDESARAALVATHGPRLWSVCRRAADHAEDAYQEVWTRVFAALAAFDPGGPATLGTWIVTVAHRYLVDQHRRRAVRGEQVPADDLPGEVVDFDAAARHRHLERALRRLPEDQRRVVVLHHVEDQPLDAIALVEGVPLGTVKSRLHRARARLLAELADLEAR